MQASDKLKENTVVQLCELSYEPDTTVVWLQKEEGGITANQYQVLLIEQMII